MNPANQPSKTLVAAIRGLLRPLVRFLLVRGVTLPFLTQLLKELYVDVAEQDFRLDDKPVTDSRISMLTGVHRKDVRRLRETEAQRREIPPTISLGAQVVSTWLSDRRYLNRQKQPKVLAIRHQNPRTASFETLVAAVSHQDLRPRVVLDELLRLGVVEISNGQVRLLEEAFIPAQGEDEKLHYFMQNLRDHLAAATANVQAIKPPFLERAVSYHGLTQEDVEELASLAKSSANDSLRAVNNRAKQLKKRSADKYDNNHRINFGAFFFSDDSDED